MLELSTSGQRLNKKERNDQIERRLVAVLMLLLTTRVHYSAHHNMYSQLRL